LRPPAAWSDDHFAQDTARRKTGSFDVFLSHITLATWPQPFLIQEGRLVNQPAFLVEMAGIEPASEEFDDEHLQA
jgi:hypothetical protein